MVTYLKGAIREFTEAIEGVAVSGTLDHLLILIPDCARFEK